MDFISLVTHQFRFLVDEFGFHAKKARTDQKNFGNSLIRFETSTIGINVVLDRGQVFIYLGQLSMPEDEWFDICDVISYFAPQIENVYLFPENLSGDASITFQVERLSDLVKTYCTTILKGDFSMERDIRAGQSHLIQPGPGADNRCPSHISGAWP
jgi:hypothetical protein